VQIVSRFAEGSPGSLLSAQLRGGRRHQDFDAPDHVPGGKSPGLM
jgi:hypothetical protein